MIIYLTYNDPPSGIYSSQVIDVVKFLRNELKAEIRLVSLISIRKFRVNRKKIKDELPDALVIPMFPGISNWRLNKFILQVVCSSLKPEKIIARSVLATQLAFMIREKRPVKVVYDGRGAIAAEWKEYGVITDRKMLEEIEQLEREAVLNSDFRIAVSNKLVEWWTEQFGYRKKEHVVIPCTLNSLYEGIHLEEKIIETKRTELGYKREDIVYVYSGSLAAWQGVNLLIDFIIPVLKQSPDNKLLILSDANDHTASLAKEFGYRVTTIKVAQKRVPDYLMAADYGLLIREQSTTNKVSSPVKFAEYLACGLMIVISDGIGDYSDFARENKCGKIISSKEEYKRADVETKVWIRQIGLNKFTKSTYSDQYKLLLRKAS